MDISFDDARLPGAQIPDHQDLVQMLFLSLSSLRGKTAESLPPF